MKKRGQTTVFIILAIFIIAAIAGGSYIISENKKSESEQFFSGSEVKPTLNSIQSDILNCAEETSKKALETIGLQGGYYKKPKYFFDLKRIFIPYYYYESLLLMPTKETIEKELSLYVSEKIDRCLQKNYQGFEISFKKPKTKASIGEKEVSFLVDLLIKIKKDSYITNFELDDHLISINSELDAILGIASFITETHKQDPAMYCINCVGALAEEDNLYVDIVKFREREMLVVISENHTSSEPYSFEFLNKYTGEEVSPSSLIQEIAPNYANAPK